MAAATLAPAVKGGLRPSQLVTWSPDDGSAMTLTGATMTGTITNRVTGVTRAIVGTLTVTNGAAGEFRWDYAAGDVSDKGEFDVQFDAAFGTPPTPARSYIARWTVHDYRTVTV
jgi:hypothetical protein